MWQQIVRDVPVVEHVVDLDQPPAERLRAVIAAERAGARALFGEVMLEFAGVPNLGVEGFGRLYRTFDGPYQDEIEQWAEALDISFAQAALVNCAYELSHVSGGATAWLGKLFGCTTALCPMEGVMVHARNLDWPIPAMAAATRLFRYRRGGREFVSVGFPLYVGVLSGMVPGEYSATINWAPPGEVPDFHHGPAFWLRRTLEECETYEAAVTRLREARLSTSVFYTVCGNRPGQGCVIERTKNEAVVREAGAGCEAQANHHVAMRFEENNEVLQASKPLRSDPLLQTTQGRRELMLAALGRAGGQGGDLSRVFDLLSPEPITNGGTVQRMVFCPARGELHLDRRLRRTETSVEWGRSVWKAK